MSFRCYFYGLSRIKNHENSFSYAPLLYSCPKALFALPAQQKTPNYQPDLQNKLGW